MSVAPRRIDPPVSRAASSLADINPVRSSPSTTATRGSASPCSRANARIRSAAPRGLGAGVSDGLDVVLQTACQHGADKSIESRIEPPPRIAPAVKLRQRKRSLGERLEHQEAWAGKFRQCIDQRTGGVRAIVREARSSADIRRRTHLWDRFQLHRHHRRVFGVTQRQRGLHVAHVRRCRELGDEGLEGLEVRRDALEHEVDLA